MDLNDCSRVETKGVDCYYSRILKKSIKMLPTAPNVTKNITYVMKHTLPYFKEMSEHIVNYHINRHNLCFHHPRGDPGKV